MRDKERGVDREGSTARSTTEFPYGVTDNLWFRTKRARSGFYGNEPLLWGERGKTGWGIYFNREGVVTAWAGGHDGACRFSVEVTIDRSDVLRARPALFVFAWCWRYHVALHIGPRRHGVDVVVDPSRSIPKLNL